MLSDAQLNQLVDAAVKKNRDEVSNAVRQVVQNFNQYGRATASKQVLTFEVAKQLADALTGCKFMDTATYFSFEESGPRDGFRDPHRA